MKHLNPITGGTGQDGEPDPDKDPKDKDTTGD